MKNFKMTIFMIVLIMIMAVSAVSAADLDNSSDADVLAVDGDAIGKWHQLMLLRK